MGKLNFSKFNVVRDIPVEVANRHGHHCDAERWEQIKYDYATQLNDRQPGCPIDFQNIIVDSNNAWELPSLGEF